MTSNGIMKQTTMPKRSSILTIHPTRRSEDNDEEENGGGGRQPPQPQSSLSLSLLQQQMQSQPQGRANKRRHTVHFADASSSSLSSSSSLAFLLNGLDLEKLSLLSDDDNNEDNAERSSGRRPPAIGDNNNAAAAVMDNEECEEEMETTSATSSIRDLNELLQSDRTTTKTFDDSIFDLSTAAFMASGIGDASWTSTSSSTLEAEGGQHYHHNDQTHDECGRSHQSHPALFLEGDNEGDDDASMSFPGPTRSSST